MKNRNSNTKKHAAALMYGGFGMKIFPVHHIRKDKSCSCKEGSNCASKGKHPIIKDGVKGATSDLEIIGSWWTQYPKANIGWCLGDNIVAVDIDIGKRIKKNGKTIELNGFTELKLIEARANRKLKSILSQRSGSGGKHLIFRLKKGTSLSSKWSGGDLKSGNAYIIIEPSNHFSGGMYEWINKDVSNIGFYLDLIQELPEWFIQATQNNRDNQSSNDKASDNLSLTLKNLPIDLAHEDFAKAVMSVKNDSRFAHHSEWFSMIAAIHHQTGGSTKGLKLALQWSDTWTEGENKPEYVRKVWRSIKGSPEGRLITARHVLKFAHEDGWKSPDMLILKQTKDIQNGQYFAQKNLNKFRFILTNKKWMKWNGSKWLNCELGEEMEAAKKIAGDLLHSAALKFNQNTTTENKENLKQSADLHNSWRLQNMLHMASTNSGIATTVSEFDRDPLIVGVKNGLYNLKTGEFLEPDPVQMVSKQLGALYDSQAIAPLWKTFLKTVLPDIEVRKFIKRAIGYSLTGLVDEEKIFFCYGHGANGKSVFANILAELMGEYSVTVGTSILTKSKFGTEADRFTASLVGKRFALANETRQGDVWDDQKVKELSSREKISARQLYKEPFEFMPTHKLWVRGNHLPGAHDAGDAFWRRMTPIHFGQQIKEQDRILDLDRKIIATELSGVLNWALEGYSEWNKIGLKTPSSIIKEIKGYREDTDLIGMWLIECCKKAPYEKLLIRDAYDSFRDYSNEQGVGVPSMMAFSRQLSAKGLKRSPDTSKRSLLDYKLI